VNNKQRKSFVEKHLMINSEEKKKKGREKKKRK
jgi:hypothetical protein